MKEGRKEERRKERILLMQIHNEILCPYPDILVGLG
jgi:hypothetical protein